MRFKELNKFVKSHGVLLPNEQVMLTQPLHAFKKVYYRQPGSMRNHDAIANLVIPIGAIVNLAQEGDGQKMRASQAYCHSIFTADGKKELDTAHSGYDNTFQYHSGTKAGMKRKDFDDLVVDASKYMGFLSPYDRNYAANKSKLHGLNRCKVVPSTFQTNSTNTCSAGIHFFVDVKRALSY